LRASGYVWEELTQGYPVPPGAKKKTVLVTQVIKILLFKYLRTNLRSFVRSFVNKINLNINNVRHSRSYGYHLQK